MFPSPSTKFRWFPPRRFQRRLPLLLPLLAAGALGGCPAPSGGPALTVQARFGGEGVPALFGSERLAAETVVATWTAAELRRRCAELPTAATGSSPGASAGGLSEKFLVRCSLAGLAGEFDALEVELQGSAGGALRLHLAGPTAAAAEVAAATAASDLVEPDRRPDGTYRYRLAPPAGGAESAGWLVVGAETRVAAHARLHRLRALRFAADAAAAERAVARRWTIALGAEWRDGVPALPGHPVHWRLPVPAGARLRLGYALGSLPAARFAVRAGGDGGELLFEGEETAAGSSGITDAADGPWREAEIDLGRWAGREIELELAVAAPGAAWNAWGAWGSPMLLAPAATPAGPPGTARLPDVLLISIDTLRADHLSLYGWQRPTSPALDAWAKRAAVVFERAFAQAPWTLPSHVSMLTGLEPLRHGVELETQAPRYRALDNLAAALARAGYRTEAVTGGGFVHPRFGFSRGFDRYRFWPADGEADAELAAGVDAALRYFDTPAAATGGAPRFLFLHTYEVHPPNRARQPWFGRFSALPADLEVAGAPGAPSIANGFVGQPTLGVHRQRAAPLEPLPEALHELPADLYDSAIGYVDSELARLFAGLAARGVLDHALVVVTSDHGESLGEWGRWNHGHLDSANLHVPLLLALPDRRGAGSRVATQVRSIDIAPTILAAVGAPALAGADGRSLLGLAGAGAPERDRPAWAYGSSNNRGLVLRAAGDLAFHFQDSAYPPVAGETTAFDLAADPGGLRDVAGREPAKVAAFRAALLRLWEPVLPAVRVELANAGSRAWRGVLRSPLIEATTVKSFDIANGEWSWAGRGKGAFEIAGGRRFTLLLQDRGRAGERLAGELEIAGCTGVLTFEVVVGETAQVVEVEPERCRLSPPRAGSAASGGSGIVFRRQGLGAGESAGADGSAGTSAADDAAIREQLRALGYI